MAWTRIFRNKYGAIESATSSEQACFAETEKHVYDSIKSNGFSCNNIDVWYYIYTQTEEQAVYENDDWWADHYDSYVTDSLGLAVRELIIKLFQEENQDIKFFLEINGENAHGETFMEIPWDVISSARELVKEGTNKRISNLEREVETLTETAQEYEDFLRSIPGGLDMFRKWRQERR